MMRRSWGAAAAVVLAVLLSGCVGDDEAAEPSASPSAPSPAISATPAPSPSATPMEPGEEPDAIAAVPLGVGCDTLVGAQALYDFNPNVGTDPAFDPASATLAPIALDMQGTACGFLNQTSGERISVAAARVETGSVAALAREVAARGGALGDGRAFRTGGSTSTLEVLAGEIWIVVEGPAVFGAEDLAPLAEAARAGAGG